MSPEEFVRVGPQSPDELIGKAALVAKTICAKVKASSGEPIRLLFHGDAGIGKSATCRIIAHALAAHPSEVRHLSAVQLTVEMVREWMNEMCYRAPSWRVYWVEEVDAVNPAVEVLLLQFLDSVTDNTAVLFTSNEAMSGLSDRLQSRMKVVRFERPSVDDVTAFLQEHWPEMGDVAVEVAEANNGDVRATLNDAQMHLDVAQFSGREGT